MASSNSRMPNGQRQGACSVATRVEVKPAPRMIRRWGDDASFGMATATPMIVGAVVVFAEEEES